MYEVIIVGSGIAGCTASIYASRKKMDFLLISKKFGGQFYESGEVLNYPGIVKTTGEKMASKFEDQLKFNEISPKLEEKVVEVGRIDNNFEIVTDKDKYKSKAVIVATGSSPKKLNVPGEDKFKNKGVTYCSICDGPLFSGKDIAIVGGGNSAL